MKTATLAAVIIAATIVPSFSREMVIVRRSPACLQQQDLSEFYKLARENPSMPPPKPDSAQTKAELQELQRLQESRTPEQEIGRAHV